METIETIDQQNPTPLLFDRNIRILCFFMATFKTNEEDAMSINQSNVMVHVSSELNNFQKQNVIDTLTRQHGISRASISKCAQPGGRALQSICH
jgi:hypothetical protein